MENMKLACSEVYCILEILGDNYKNKLPTKFLDFINQNRSVDYFLNIDGEDYENLNISKDALILVSFLNLKYWVEDEEEKLRLIEIYKKNDEKRNELINKYNNANWLNQAKYEENTIENSNTDPETSNTNIDTQEELNEENRKEQGKELVEIKKDSIFDKIKKIIKKFFYKKKE